MLAAQAGSIEPGAEAETVVLVRNTSDEADVFHVVVQGPASAWAVVDPTSVRLGPGEETPVWVHFRPPRSFDTPPGPVTFAVAVASSGDPDFVAVETGELDIGTFSSVSAAFTAEPVVGTRWVEVPVSVRNTGNRTVTVSVDAEPAASGVTVEVDPPHRVLEPGQPGVMAVKVRPPRRVLPHRREDRRLTVSVVSDGGALATLRTEYPADPSLVNELIRSARVLGVLLVLLFIGGIALLRSESTSGTVDVTEGTAAPAELPQASTTAPPEPEAEDEQAEVATEELQPPAAAPVVTARPVAPAPALPKMVFVRVYGPDDRDIVVRDAGSRANELRLRGGGGEEARPRLSPDGQHVAYIRERDAAWRVCVVPASGGESVCVADTTGDAAVAWAPDGATLHFSRAGTLYSVPYDRTTETAGPEVDRGIAVPGGNFSLSPDGTRIAVAEGRRIAVRPIDGSGAVSIEVPRPASEVSFSPDGSRLVFTAEYQVHVVGVGGGPVRQLTSPSTVNGEAAWTGAGDWIVFRSNRTGAGDLYAVNGGATGGDEAGLAQVTSTDHREITPSF